MMKALALFLVLAGLLWQCKLHRAGDSEEQSIRSADDALKIAVNYIGDAACVNYWKGKGNEAKSSEVIAYNKNRARQIVAHMLNGPNGELISEEYRASAPHRKHLLLSGDIFFDNMRSKNSPLDMQTIADNCRRLVLSVDSDIPPTITFEKGFAVRSQKQSLKKMDVHGKFGDTICLQDQPFCSLECVANPNATCSANKRYFVLIWPDQETKQVKANVEWKTNNKKDSSTITISHLTFQDDAPAMWQPPAVQPPEITKPSEPESPSVTETEPITPETPAQTGKVFTADGLATVAVSESKRIAGSDEAEVTLELTALQDIRAKWDGSAKVKVSSLNPYKFAENPVSFSIPTRIHPNQPNLYSGNKFFEMRVTDKNWTKSKKLTMKFRVKLHSRGSASFKLTMSSPALIRQWEVFKDAAGNELIISVPK